MFMGAIGALAVMTVLSAGIGFALPNLLPRLYTHYAAIVLVRVPPPSRFPYYFHTWRCFRAWCGPHVPGCGAVRVFRLQAAEGRVQHAGRVRRRPRVRGRLCFPSCYLFGVSS